jgi:hypothetical protein
MEELFMALRHARRRYNSRSSRRFSSHAHRGLEQLESRLLLTASFTPDDVDLTWRYVGMSASGTVELDDANNIVAITFNTDAGTTTHPTGTYTVGSGGGFDMNLSTPANPGGSINSKRSSISLAEVGVQNSLALMINPASGATVADINGSWGLYFNGNAADNSGLGTITFNGLGGVVSGSGKDSSGTTTITGGTYTVDNAGVVNVELNVKEASGQTGTLSLVGALNSTKDLIALNPPDLQAAGVDDATRMFVMVKHTGAFSVANVAGQWAFSSDQTDGSFLVDALGNLQGQMSNGDGAFDLTGKITITPTGSVTLKINATQGNVTTPFTFTGTMSTSKDVIVANFVGGGGENMTIFNHPNNHIPTLTTVSTLGTATAAIDFTIPFATLQAAANEADADGDTLEFQIMSVDSGTLLVDGVEPNSFPFTVHVGDPLVWTPSLNAKGKVNAFKIRAFDGSDSSASDVQVTINVNAAPTISIAATKPKASELNNGTTKGIGQFTFTRTGSNALPLDVDYTIDESALNTSDNGGDYPSIFTTTVHFDAGKSTATVNIVPIDDIATEGNETVTFVLDAGDTYIVGAKNTAVVTIADYELAPEALTGATFNASVTDGSNPFDSTGKFTITFGSDNTQYILFGSEPITSSSGTFTYTRLTSTTGEIDMIDSVYGNFTATLTFSSTSKCTFDFQGGGGDQQGTATFFIPQAFAPASIDGRTFSVKVLDGLAPSESTGQFSFTFSEGSGLYAITGTPVNIRSHGGFAYLQFSPNSAIISTNDSV